MSDGVGRQYSSHRTKGVLMLKPFANKAEDIRSTESNSLSADCTESVSPLAQWCISPIAR